MSLRVRAGKLIGLTITWTLLALAGLGQTPRLVIPPILSSLNPQQPVPLRDAVPAQLSPLIIDLAGALTRARTGGQQYLAAGFESQIATEERLQAKAALLPSVDYNNQYILTQSNGAGGPVFISGDGVHVYTSQGVVHSEAFSATRRLEYRRALAAEALARARQDVALRGLSLSVIGSYYALVSAQRKLINAQRSLDEAQSFVDVTQRLEAGGEVAHADVIKAQILLEQRRREVLDAQLAIDKGRIGLAVFIFADYNEDFTVTDDVASIAPLGSLPDVTTAARATSPDIRVAQNALTQEGVGLSIARSGLRPSLTLDYLYGINANEFATRNGDRQNLGFSAQATLNIPIWNWGAQRSRIRQAELKRQQAQLELALTQKEFAAGLNSLYREAQTARAQTDSLRTSLDLATESLRLILLRYQAGEVSVLEVADAQTTLSEARNAYDEGLARYRSAWANIQVVTGIF